MFFNTRDFQQPRISMDTIREWSGSIANSYLNAGTPPTESLMKLAHTEDLPPHHIELLAGEINKLIHTAKFANASDKYFAADFPHADARQVISSLQASGSVKVAARAPDPVFTDNGPSADEMFGVEVKPMDKTAELRSELGGAHEKLALLKNKADDALLLAKYATRGAEVAFIKQARQLCLGADNASERLQALGLIGHMVKTAKVDEARPALAKLAALLGEEGLLLPGQSSKAVDFFLKKEADAKAPTELISGWMQAKVINGNHPLYISLKTFRDCTQRERECSERRNLLDDKLNVVRERVRAL